MHKLAVAIWVEVRFQLWRQDIEDSDGGREERQFFYELLRASAPPKGRIVLH